MSDVIAIKTIEADGIQMGVLEDGTPFLTGRGLAIVCGVAPKTVNDWGKESPKIGVTLKGSKMAELLISQGFEGVYLYQKILFKGQEVNAYPDSVCMAFMEYYAFEAGRYCTESAKTNYRVLARKTLREFIYRTVGYDPKDVISLDWRHFHDRLVLNPVPIGYYSAFKEMADVVVCSIREGLIVDSHTVPDISVGKLWSKYWQDNNLEEIYGLRVKYPHNYPDYFPQSQNNSNIQAFLYPIESLGYFRNWLYTTYIPEKFPSYLKRKVKQGAIPASSVELLLKAVTPLELSGE